MSKTIAGALIGRALGSFGDKFEMPPWEQIDPAQIQSQTVTGNLGVLAQAQSLAAAVNKGNAAQLRAILNRGGQLDLAESITASQMRGELPQDIQRLLANQVAAQSLGLGLGGTGFQAGRGALANVLSSFQLQQQGIQNFGALARLTTPNLMGPETMFFTPQQRLQFAFQDRAAKLQYDITAAQVAAAPNPADVALGEGFDNFFAFWASVGGAALGGMGGGGALSTKGNPGWGQSGGPAFQGDVNINPGTFGLS
jgi:hypothetical protein